MLLEVGNVKDSKVQGNDLKPSGLLDQKAFRTIISTLLRFGFLV
jgi:hypothetical protein